MKAYPKKTRFAVWGYGVTGQALASVLSERDYIIHVIEDRDESSFASSAGEIERLRNAGATFHFGGMSDLAGFVAANADVLSPSPGIKISPSLIAACDKAKVQIAGEIEIGSRMVSGKIIAITGTDGKTTVTSLIHHILASSGKEAHLAGNIGSPLISLAGCTKPDHWIVCEVSSYQLESVRLFRPHIAVLTNIAEDHLERHGDMKNYARMKARIFDRQRPTDYAIINYDDPPCIQAYGQSKSALYGFTLAGPVPKGAWRDSNVLRYSDGEKSVGIMKTEDLQILGDHNHLNVLASIIACSLAECTPEQIASAAASFRNLPHRIEKIGEINGVLWVNDSKATNVHSTMSALKSFDRPIILLLGGYEKNLDITELIPLLRRNVRHVILLGATRNRFRRILRDAGYIAITLRKTLAEACTAAYGIAEKGDVVLLSPASSSFDQFKDYAERGETFRKWVNKKMEKADT